MNALVTVVTPTVPSRQQLLDECAASVSAQTVEVAHLVAVDEHGEGPATVRNRIVAQAETEWVLPVDDDDTLDPNAVQTLLDRADADIVYPWCRMEGRTDGWVTNMLFNAATLFKRPFIPVTALIKRDTWMMLGGQRRVPMEDYDFYRRAWLHGCTFQCVPEVLWSYRFHADNRFQKQAA